MPSWNPYLQQLPNKSANPEALVVEGGMAPLVLLALVVVVPLMKVIQFTPLLLISHIVIHLSHHSRDTFPRSKV
jgi:hypothetical protein